MIVGLGSDLIQINRVQQTLDRHGERFTQRCFTEIERKKSDRRAQRAASYAKRFAAKEAALKALGTGLSLGVNWRELEVRRERGQPPSLVLSGRSREISRRRGGRQMLVTLTHDGDYAMAQAMLVGDEEPPDPAGARDADASRR